ncbi:MAG: inorganic phosphate transporter [Omnitrophica bacterium RIFCSPLOWO2_12_FULL_44_17]|uniref:Inorganic phosphate transporter n=1 Tax=Candidatus Danuiimicrobium aquiferis TaxID=1801832 RepID=A0A1G1L1F2_9BACT|nr:MAG: inorganic phosphate transporter [Omnitrophica bacterium RIFCSPHIGHO2_02_FULL_45_28]OGW98972.1 MAG: inorganic phosphate transporter [Omnitrophica bacterium RIFCSPLOWO2_12_FULL_44_17]OGX01596.1 MAG: inorganic phosphate transporter [Omnitrophica bacterium RIFCSPLOWO2_02_FULL_44_11]
MTFYILFLIFLALTFDFLNGFHDSANSIATIVSTRVLSPRYAVIWAAFFNFIAFLFFGLHVANTIGKGIIDIAIVDQHVIFGTLIGACGWNIITWYFGLPTSSSHALIGGMIGSALLKAGPTALVWKGILKTVSFIFISPVVGLILGLGIGIAVHWIFRRATPSKVDHIFRKGQLISAACYSLGHGGNDAQKTMGIIASLLFSAGLLGGKFHIPFWVVIACHTAIALGTMFGGWRIVKTMGQKVAKLRPIDGFCAETGAAITLFFSSMAGIPVSTTHTITGAIMGIGSLKRVSAVRWGIAGTIVWAWILTIPCAATISALAYLLVS